MIWFQIIFPVVISSIPLQRDAFYSLRQSAVLLSKSKQWDFMSQETMNLLAEMKLWFVARVEVFKWNCVVDSPGRCSDLFKTHWKKYFLYNMKKSCR